MFYFGFDPTIILLIIGAVITLVAQMKLKGTFANYSRITSSNGITGKEAAEQILRANGIFDVSVQKINGTLTDCYVPSKKIVYLSDSSYQSTSIAAIGVAAHECGHAIQDASEYTPLVITNAIAPVCKIGSSAGFYVLLLGMFFSFDFLIDLGLILFGLGVVVSLILLPVEYNASNRALAVLSNLNILNSEELSGTKKVLRAAGLTYVAAAASSVLTLLRLFLLSGRRNRE